MAPLPENNTNRFWVDYNDGMNDHSLQVRYDDSGGGLTFAKSSAALFLTALSPQLYAITVTGARYSLATTTISLPTPWSASTTFGTGAMPGSVAPRQLCYLARDGQGRQVRWFVFGCKLETPNDYRFSLGENSDLAEAWGVISDAQNGGAFLSIAGLNPEMYSYIDVNFNSYYEAKTRG